MKLYEQQELHIYNSLSKTKEKFKPIHEGAIGMYVCGPTVYSNVHMGNCRTFLSFDLVYRYLRHLEYKVRMFEILPMPDILKTTVKAVKIPS